MRTIQVKTCNGFREYVWRDGALVTPEQRSEVAKEESTLARFHAEEARWARNQVLRWIKEMFERVRTEK